MAFSFGNPGGAVSGNAPGSGGVTEGPPLEIIQTEALAFKSIAGDAKVRLTSPWEQPPTTNASLLTIAPRKGIVAAAGPDSITITSTETVRKAFEDGKKAGDSEVRTFDPQMKLPLPMRVSQIAFTADESYLVLSAESGGGLAVYETQSLLQGNTQASFELSTNGESLRALSPNPTIEKAELCALVTTNGNLHMADFKNRQISNVLKSQVSCLSWSNKGKQLVAGLADGTLYQMTPEGVGKGEIPRPASVPNSHVNSLLWLENNLFLVVHTSTNQSPPETTYHLIQRDTQNASHSFTFQKMIDPVDPFGAEKAPHYTFVRLRDFPPNLQDLLIVCSTESVDVGLLSRSKTPLTPEKSADAVVNVFTTTELLDDAKRAQLPMSESMDNTIPIGATLDLSGKSKVYKPLPADEELEESPGPVPGYWVLNNEGVLSAWWVIYEESIRQGTSYPGMAGVDVSATSAAPTAPGTTAVPSSAFGSAPAASALSSAPSFGSAPAFGGASALGAKPSPWGAATTSTSNNAGQTSAFGSGGTFGNTTTSSGPSFGQTSAFGQSAQLGAVKSPWATAGAGAGAGAATGSSAPAFGQTGFANLGNTTSSPFASAAPTSGSGGFASFANSSGFAAAGANNNSGGSIFGKPSSGSPFSSSTKPGDTAFPPPKIDSSSGGLSGSGTAFKLDSSFKADPAKKDEDGKPGVGGEPSLFGSGFGSALGDAAKQESAKDLDMDATSAAEPEAKSQISLGGQSSEKPTEPIKSPFGLGQTGTSSTSGTKSLFSTGDTSKADSKVPFGLASQASSSATSPFAPAPQTSALSPFGSAGTQTGAFSKSPFATTSESKSLFGSQPSQATPAKSTFGSVSGSATLFGNQPSQTAATTSPFAFPKNDDSQSSRAANPFSLGSAKVQPTSSLFASQPKSPLGLSAPESTTPTTTPAPNRFSFATDNDATTPKGTLFGQAPKNGLFKTPEPLKSTPEIKVEEEEAPLPPESTSRNTYPLGESSASSAATEAGSKGSKPESAPLPPDFISTPKPASTMTAESAPLPPDFTTTPKTAKPDEKTKSSGIVFTYAPVEDTSDDSDDASEEGELKEMKRQPKKPIHSKKHLQGKPQTRKVARVPSLPESSEEEEDEEEDNNEDAESEGSGVMVGKDTSPSMSGLTATPGFTPQSSFGGLAANNQTTSQTGMEKPRSSLFGEMSRNAPVFPRPHATSPRSPSPVRSAIPNRMSQLNTSRSVSAPGMASQILGASKRQSVNMTAVPSKAEEDPQLKAQRLARSRREAEETKVLEDEDDDEIQKILRSNIEPSLKMDDFIAHTNVAPSSQETIPSQVEAVYRDINSMIDTLGLNARSLASFIKGHLQSYKQGGRGKEDLENADDWVLCEVNDLGQVINTELAKDLADGRVRHVEAKVDTCQDLAREMSRLRSKQEDLKKLITVRLDPDQAEISRSLPLSTEQAAQQNELRREYARFSKLLAEAEEALTLLKTKLAALDAASGKNNANVPTVDAVLRTITKMTSMVEKRSGDVDVLENQMRKLRFSSVNSREGSPVVTPQKHTRSIMFSPERGTGSPRNLRNSFMSPAPGAGANTTPRKKLSGFSAEEKKELTAKRAKRKAILDKLKANVEKNGVQPWTMPDDIE